MISITLILIVIHNILEIIFFIELLLSWGIPYHLITNKKSMLQPGETFRGEPANWDKNL